MSLQASRTNTISTGLAMFSMFFGAGNVVFPLLIGVYSQDMNVYAMLGLMITGVLVPFIGLAAMTLFDGSYRHFFARIGKTPGFILEILIMGLIGPFGAIPRTITLSFSTIKNYIPGLSLPVFSLGACILIYLLTYRRKNILDILGYFLTPFLLISLACIITKGLWLGGELPVSSLTGLQAFTHGIREGYQTMDLMGAFFFSSVVILCLKQALHPTEHQDMRKLIVMTLKASCIGAGLLAIVYIGFSFVSAINGDHLVGVPPAQMIGALAHVILGPYGGFVASSAVSLACLTTAIALSSVFAEFIHEDITDYRVGYRTSLVASLAATFLVSILGFDWIISFLAPILIICYPALITLSIANLLYKLCNFKPVKSIFFGVLIASIIAYAVPF